MGDADWPSNVPEVTQPFRARTGTQTQTGFRVGGPFLAPFLMTTRNARSHLAEMLGVERNVVGPGCVSRFREPRRGAWGVRNGERVKGCCKDRRLLRRTGQAARPSAGFWRPLLVMAQKRRV